jgi:hypothetical protein
MMMEEEREQLFASDTRAVLKHIVGIYVGPDEIRRIKAATMRTLKTIGAKESVAHYLVRCRAGARQVVMVGGAVCVDDLIELIYESMEGHKHCTTISTLLADYPIGGQGPSRESCESYLYRLATRQCQITRESLAKLENEMDLFVHAPAPPRPLETSQWTSTPLTDGAAQKDATSAVNQDTSHVSAPNDRRDPPPPEPTDRR